MNEKDQDINKILLSIQRRITLLESDIEHIDSLTTKVQAIKKRGYEKLGLEKQEMRDLVNETKEINRKNTDKMIDLAENMRDALKKENLDQVSRTVDDIEFHEFMTKKEAERIVDDYTNK